jgi:hypothetical protein
VINDKYHLEFTTSSFKSIHLTFNIYLTLTYMYVHSHTLSTRPPFGWSYCSQIHSYNHLFNHSFMRLAEPHSAVLRWELRCVPQFQACHSAEATRASMGFRRHPHRHLLDRRARVGSAGLIHRLLLLTSSLIMMFESLHHSL